LSSATEQLIINEDSSQIEKREVQRVEEFLVNHGDIELGIEYVELFERDLQRKTVYNRNPSVLKMMIKKSQERRDLVENF
jgi:hypothetical protein